VAPRAQQKKRGAPKGHGNALKHGVRTAEMARLRRETRVAIARMRYLTKLAWEFVLLRAIEKKASKRALGSASPSRRDSATPWRCLRRMQRAPAKEMR
jgi:hypothetical protein